MPSPAQHVTEALLRARFGPEAIIRQMGGIWLVHVDQPSQAEIEEREAELQQDMTNPDDCTCCDLMRPQADDTVIFDGPMCLIEPAPGRKFFPEAEEGESDKPAASI